MRVVFVSAYFRPHVGGIERFVENLAHGLVARGHEITVICFRTEPESPLSEKIDGYRIERIPATNRPERGFGVPYPLPQPIALVRTLIRCLADADVAHVQDALYASSLPALLLSRWRGIPSVLTQHVGFVPQRTRWLNALERAALATIGRSSRLADIIATYNASVAEWAAAHWGLRDVRVLPVGVPMPSSSLHDRAEVRQSFGLSRDRFLALFVGRNVSKKGLDVFLAASDPAYELIAVTDRLAPASDVRILPFMAPDRLQELLSCIDAFVLPSEGEGFPISIQEALGHGLPVVTTWQPGYDHYVSRDDVLYVERDARSIRAALKRLLAEEELRQRLSERARAVAARHFSIDRFVDAYEALYEEARGTRDRHVAGD